mgnify:CR=1 FL=1
MILEENEKTLVFTFGRYNPPTTGHLKLIEQVEVVASEYGAPYRIYASQSQNPKKNPLEYKEKIEYMKELFPKHKNSIVYNTHFRTIFDILEELDAEGITNIIMVVGDDRVDSFQSLLTKYNGVEYNFKNIKVLSAGQRDPDADGVEGISATKMRQAAASNMFKAFQAGLPLDTPEELATRLFKSLQDGMGMQESLRDMLISAVEEVVSETSTMAGGAVAGYPGGFEKKKNKKRKTNY